MIGFHMNLQAQTMVIWEKNGSKTYYELSEKPISTFAYKSLIVTTITEGEKGQTYCVSIEYPVSRIKKYTYEDLSTGIDLTRDESDVRVRFNGSDITFDNLSTDSRIAVYSPKGNVLSRLQGQQGATTTVSLKDYPKGVYIVKVGDVTYKIAKQ